MVYTCEVVTAAESTTDSYRFTGCNYDFWAGGCVSSQSANR